MERFAAAVRTGRIFRTLESLKIEFCLATNNSTATPEQYVEKLKRMGVSVSRARVIISAVAAALYLSNSVPRGTRVFVIGELSVHTALREVGLEIVEDNAEFVVVGLDRQLAWEKLIKATLAFRAGAP